MSEANKEVMLGIAEMFNGADPSNADRLISADMADHEDIPGVDTQGAEGFKRVLAMFRSAFPDLQITPEQLVAEGDLVIAHFRMTGTHTSEFMGIPATGKRFEIHGFDMIRVKDGKAVEHWGISDNAAMMQQLSVAPQD